MKDLEGEELAGFQQEKCIFGSVRTAMSLHNKNQH
jgi:hypothetical protein